MKKPTPYEIIKSTADGLGIELLNGGATAEEWRDIAERLAVCMSDWLEALPVEDWNGAVSEVARRQAGDRKRVENRTSTKDKIKVQSYYKENKDKFTSIAQAVREAKKSIKSIERVKEPSLRKWVSEVWDKPRKRGRPPKNSDL